MGEYERWVRVKKGIACLLALGESDVVLILYAERVLFDQHPQGVLTDVEPDDGIGMERRALVSDESTGGDSTVGGDVEENSVADYVVQERGLVGRTFGGVFKCFDEADGTGAESANEVEVGDEYDLGSDFEVEITWRGHLSEETRKVFGWCSAGVASVEPGGGTVEANEMVVIGPEDLFLLGAQLDDGLVWRQRTAECREFSECPRADSRQADILQELDKI